jgi:RNA polymerase sigma factor (sigma-70 family)
VPVAPRRSKARPWLSGIVLRSQTDERLTALAREGHDQAFAAIAQRYRRELMAHARRVAPAGRAEDVLQQALLSAWSALGRQGDVRDTRAWLHRIVHNTGVRDARRDERHEKLPEGVAGGSKTDVTAELRIEARAALAAVAALPDSQRRALELTALGDASGQDAAAALGVSEGSLRQLVHRARVTLRSGLAGLTPTPLLMWAADGGDGMATRLPELSAGAGLAATAVKVCATAAATASLAGGATQLWTARSEHHQRPGHRAAAAAALPVAAEPSVVAAAPGANLSNLSGATAFAGSGEPVAARRGVAASLVGWHQTAPAAARATGPGDPARAGGERAHGGGSDGGSVEGGGATGGGAHGGGADGGGLDGGGRGGDGRGGDHAAGARGELGSHGESGAVPASAGPAGAWKTESGDRGAQGSNGDGRAGGAPQQANPAPDGALASPHEAPQVPDGGGA